MLRQVSPDGDVGAMECSPTREIEASFSRSTRSLAKDTDGAIAGLRALVGGTAEELSADQALGLEAIVLPRYRPVVDIVDDEFQTPPKPWTHLGTKRVRKLVNQVIPCVGRVEVPTHPTRPYAGTGFVVGDGILMTNRHVAEVFALGLGQKRLDFQAGQSASLDFRREIKPSDPVLLDVVEVLMIHPHFDMALLRVEGLSKHQVPLKLDVSDPSDLIENDVVVIGYPAQDLRNDQELQNQVFRGAYNVKRLQPGKLRSTERLKDFYGNLVDTITHDCSTLGGNSGSAVIDIATGNVVALHFAGKYLKANYAIPIHELARDRRIAETDIHFSDTVPATNAWETKWKVADAEIIQDASSRKMVNDVAMVPRSSWNVPLNIEVSFGDQTVNASPIVKIPSGFLDDSSRIRIPKIADQIAARDGYQSDFLVTLSDPKPLDLPSLTLRGRRAAARLDDDSFVLRYHHFSVVMHKQRRLAMLAAANVHYHTDQRKVDGRIPSRSELSGLPQEFDEQWITDARLPQLHQMPDVLMLRSQETLLHRPFVRPTRVSWGDSLAEMQKANGDTYHTTNCFPTTSGEKRDRKSEDRWGRLEDTVQKQTNVKKLSVFCGPIFDRQDPVIHGDDKHGRVDFQVPQGDWKVIVVPKRRGLEAYGFVRHETLRTSARFKVNASQAWRRHQVPIREIQNLTGRLFDLRELIDMDNLG